MPPRIATASAAALLTVLLAACTAAPTTDSSSPATGPTDSTGTTSTSTFPACDKVLAAMPEVLAGLTFDESVSAAQTADEVYEQRVCVFTSPDATTQVGVTLAAIPFLSTEIETYGAAPTAIADDRTDEHNAVLQTLKVGDADDGHLDSALYLFDQQYSITIQGLGADGGSTLATLPQLTLAAATDAAFAVRALID